MSPLLRFRAVLMVGRELAIEINARNERAAVDIATYLFNTHGEQFFQATPEEIIDVQAPEAD